jgi:hypothetical protein
MLVFALDGTTRTLVEQTERDDWWNDLRIGTLGSEALSLLLAVRSGTPLSIFTAASTSHRIRWSTPLSVK